jgi:hypothetical protein
MKFITRVMRSDLKQGHGVGSANYRREAEAIAKDRMRSTWPHVKSIRVTVYEEFSSNDTVAATITLDSPAVASDWSDR